MSALTVVAKRDSDGTCPPFTSSWFNESRDATAYDEASRVPRIDPNEARCLPPGEAFVIAEGRAERIRVDHLDIIEEKRFIPLVGKSASATSHARSYGDAATRPEIFSRPSDHRFQMTTQTPTSISEMHCS